MEQMQLNCYNDGSFCTFRWQVQPRSGSNCFWNLPERPLCPVNWWGFLLWMASLQHSKQDWSRCAESKNKMGLRGGENRRHYETHSSCKIEHDFDFPRARSWTVEMWNRLLLPDTSLYMARSNGKYCTLVPVQCHASNKGIIGQNVSQRHSSLLGWNAISWLPLSSANYVCWSYCSTCLQAVIDSFETNMLYTEQKWILPKEVV